MSGAGRMGSARDLPALHKTDQRYKPGETRSEDPEEEARQKNIKGILNKLTPDNFERLLQKLLDVGFTEPKTLVGLINQVFDKALGEPHFCELYSQLCHVLQRQLPEFDDPEDTEKKRKITFRRLLLNKCQEEFEKGDAAFTAVAQREEAAKREEEEKKKAGGDKAGPNDKEDDMEEGEIPSTAPKEGAGSEAEQARAAKLAERRAAEEELKARRRMLGNIQFIGHLYRYRMLTENIMHSCILRLMQDDRNPKPEDIECLCKLLSTIGQQLENPEVKPGKVSKEEALQAAKARMDVYMQRITRMSRNEALDSRLRFMLLDVIEMRSRGWEMRRKAEGPKKIEDVHREARREAAGVARRGSMAPPERVAPPGYPADGRSSHLRREDLPTRPIGASLAARQASEELSFRPQGFSMKGMSPMRGARMGPLPGGGEPSRMGAPPPPPRDRPSASMAGASAQAAVAAAAAAAAMAAAGQATSAAPMRPPLARESDSDGGAGAKDSSAGASEEQVKGCMRNVVSSAVMENNMEEAMDILDDLRGSNMGVACKHMLLEALEVRGVPIDERLGRLTPLLEAAMAGRDGSPPMLTPGDVAAGVLGVVEVLPDLIEENKKAPVMLARFAAGHLGDDTLSVGGLVQAMLDAKAAEGGMDDDQQPEDPPLVDQDVAAPFVLELLNTVKDARGEEEAKAMWQSSGLSLEQLLPSFDRDSKSVQKVVEKHGAQYLMQ